MQRSCGFVMISFLMLLFARLAGQDSLHIVNLRPYTVSVGFNKTSNLIFPYAIKSVDRGSSSVIVQKAKGVENILQVKANRQGFAQTNLSVVTTDGKFYSFLLDYSSDPPLLNISVGPSSEVVLLPEKVNASSIELAGEQVLDAASFTHVSERSQLIQLELQSIYLKDEQMWFAFKLANGSLIPFHPGEVRFFLEDRRRAKRTAVQQQEISPLYHTPIYSVDGNGWMRFACAFIPFVIPRIKRLIVMLAAARSPGVTDGRSIRLKVRAGTILKTKRLY